MKEELEDYKKKLQELKTDCIALWKSTHSVPLPNLCLGMGEEGPAAIEAHGAGLDAGAADAAGSAGQDARMIDRIAAATGATPLKREKDANTAILPTFVDLTGDMTDEVKEWVRGHCLNSVMNDVNESNFRPAYSTTKDQGSFETLVYKSVGILQMGKHHSAGRMWQHWAPLVTVLNLV